MTRSATASLALLSAALLAACGGDDPSAESKRTVAKAAPTAATKLTATVTTGSGTAYLVEAFGGIWVGNHTADTVVKIDPETNRVADSIEVPGEPTGISEGFGSLWTFTPLGEPLVQRIDPEAGKVAATIPVTAGGGSLQGPVEAAGAMWLAAEDGWITRIDPGTNRARRTLRLPAGDFECAGTLVAVGRGLWYAPEGCGDTAFRIDPRTSRVTARVKAGDGYLTAITEGGGSLWLLTQQGEVLRVDPRTGKVRERSAVADSGGFIAFGEGALWVRADAERLVKVDVETLKAVRVDRLPAAPLPGDILAAGGAVWAANFGEGTVTRVEP